MEKHTQFSIWYFIAVSIGLLQQDIWQQARQVEPIAYSELQRLFEEGRVQETAVRKCTPA